MKRKVIKRFPDVPGYSAEFTQALRELTAEKGGGYFTVREVQERADELEVIPPLPCPLPPLQPRLPPL